MENTRYENAVRLFEEAHGEDPRTVRAGDGELPWSPYYHRRMRYWLERLEPDAGEPLRLAVCCQHIRRWTIPRSEYPGGRTGYRQWRRELARFHAEEAGAILRRCGYDEGIVGRVGALLRKEGIKTDREVQTLEDVACLVFLENEFAGFAPKHDEAKVVAILRKTWAKMSERGRREALRLADTLPPEAAGLVRKALEKGEG